MSRGKRRFPVTSGTAGSRGAICPSNVLNFLIFLWSAATATRHPFAVSENESLHGRLSLGQPAGLETVFGRAAWLCSRNPQECEARQEDQYVQRALSCCSVFYGGITLHAGATEHAGDREWAPSKLVGGRRPSCIFQAALAACASVNGVPRRSTASRYSTSLRATAKVA